MGDPEYIEEGFDLLSDEQIISDEVYENIINIEDEFIIYFKDDRKFIGKISDIDDVDNIITIIDEVNNFIKLKTKEGFILLKTTDYEIIDIEKVIEFTKEEEEEEFDDLIVEQLKQDIYPEINFETIEKEIKGYSYTNYEKREILLSSIVDSFNIYDNKLFISEFSESLDVLLSLKENDVNNYLNTYLDIPFWLTPISLNYKKVYSEEVETKEIIKPNVIVNGCYDELIKLYNIKQNANNYIDFMKQSYNDTFYPTQNIETDTGYQTEYEGSYLMNMEDFEIDYRKTMNEIYFNDIEGDKQLLINKETINFNRFILYPNKYYNLNYNIDIYNTKISLQEKIYYNHILKNQDYKKELGDALNTDIVNNSLDSTEHVYDNNKILIFKTLEKIDQKLFLEKMGEKLPTIKELLEDIDIPIYNYLDVEKLLLQYDINNSDMTIKDKEYINDKIKISLSKLKKNKYPIKKSDNIDTNVIKRSPSKNVKLIKDFIYKELNINTKNYYLEKFIDKYTKTKGDSNWLYSIYTDEQLICKHHKLSCKITNDNKAYGSLIDSWGGEIKDGIIYCKNCGEYLAPEDFSVLEGFEGDKPIQNKAIIEQKQVDVYADLSQNELNDIKLIKLLSINIGINLIDNDIIDILKLYKLIDDEKIADERYQKINIMKVNYPKLIDSKSKLSLKKYKKLQVTIGNYLKDSNKVIFFYCCILIFIQINIPGYVNSLDDSGLLNLKNPDFLKLLAEKNSDIIDKNGVKLILKKINTLSKSLDNPIWNNCKIFIKEYTNPSVLKPEDQIINSIIYILSPFYPILMNKINNYYTNNISGNIGFIKNYWNTYKPLPSNKLVLKVNSQLNDKEMEEKNKKYYLKQNLIDYTLENISNIKNINDKEPVYKNYKIKISDIMNNPSFERLYNYVIYLHGTHINSPYINLLINRFIDTIDNKNKTQILAIFSREGWNKETLSFKGDKISIIKLKNTMVQVINYYKQTNLDDINNNDHVVFNNVKLTFINTLPKRIYVSIPEDIFKNMNRDVLLEKLKNKYCYDKYDNIIINDSNINHSISIHYDSNKMISACMKPITDKNVQTIIYKLNESKSLQPIYKYDNSIVKIFYEKRIIDYINLNPILKKDKTFKDLYEISLNIIKETGEDGREYNEIYKSIKTETNDMIDEIIDFIKTYPKLDEILKNLNETTSIFGKDYINLKNLIYPLKPGDEGYNANFPLEGLNNSQYQYFTNYIFRTTSSIVNQRGNDIIIPKWWKMTDYYHILMQDFLNDNYLVNHNDIFITMKNKNTYSKYFENNIYFEKFFDYIRQFSNHTDILKGVDKSKFNKERSERLQKYRFVKLLHKFIDYIETLTDDETEESIESSVLYKSLSDEHDYSLTDSIDVLSMYLIELIIDILQEYNDPTWIMNINNKRLMEKLSVQKEREKLEITSKLDKMDANERYVHVQKQNIGAVVWFKDAEEAHKKYINSEEFKQSTLKEREEYFKNLYKQSAPELDVIQSEGLGEVNVNLSPQNEPEQEGYDYDYDVDNDDDNDDNDEIDDDDI